MTTPYWVEVEPITPESVDNSDTDSASDFLDSGVFSGGEDLEDANQQVVIGSDRNVTFSEHTSSFTDPYPTLKTSEKLHFYDAAAILRQNGDLIKKTFDSSKYLQTSLNVNAFKPVKKPKSPRKQPTPVRSPKRHDPNFRGVILKFKIRFLRRRQHRLVIKTKYCCARRTNRCRAHQHHSCLPGESSSSDSETAVTTVRWHCREGKQCASCTTRKTPLWRDAEDGTPLCNACGIRYKKYRIRCLSCWYIPRKANKSYPVCMNCGDRVQHTYHNRRPSSLVER